MSNIALVSNQRKLVASEDLDQQIATLNSLISNPPQNSRTVEIGPKLAEYILANINIGNRPKKVKKIVARIWKKCLNSLIERLSRKRELAVS